MTVIMMMVMMMNVFLCGMDDIVDDVVDDIVCSFLPKASSQTLRHLTLLPNEQISSQELHFHLKI